jgi:hypothetical protein
LFARRAVRSSVAVAVGGLTSGPLNAASCTFGVAEVAEPATSGWRHESRAGSPDGASVRHQRSRRPRPPSDRRLADHLPMNDARVANSRLIVRAAPTESAGRIDNTRPLVV